jgi:hypothetical protein
MLFQVTLIQMQEEGKRPEAKFDPPDFHPERLPIGKVR